MNASANAALFRELPSVDELLHSPALAKATANPIVLREAVRHFLSELRAEIASGDLAASTLQQRLQALPDAVLSHLEHSQRYSLKPVINATGVILHTNLGRAPLSQAALEHIVGIAGDYNNLEYEIASGERGKRDDHAGHLFSRLFTGIEYEDKSTVNTIVVNNCAAATILALNTFADGGEVIVSRGELVEIGGSFRVPDIMAKSGAVLREVGTTNRTRISDYEEAITPNTRLIMRVSRSNFALIGFTEEPSIGQLVELGHRRGVPVFEDHGNGALLNLQSAGIHEVHTVQESLRAGVDVVSYSGDKLLGGPQAGMLSGRASLIRAMRANPFFRALRADKLTYAALQATLTAYLHEDYDQLPALRMIRMTTSEILERAEALRTDIESTTRFAATIVAGKSVIGGGTPPTATLPTHLVALNSDAVNAEELEQTLRGADPAIITRIEDGRVVLDLRTVFPEQDAQIVKTLQSLQG